MLDLLLSGGDSFNPVALLYDNYDLWHGHGKEFMLNLNAAIGAGEWVHKPGSPESELGVFRFHEHGIWPYVRISKHVVYMFIATFSVIGIALMARASAKKHEGGAPKGMLNFFEPIVTFVRDHMCYPNIKDPHDHHDDDHGHGGHGEHHEETHKLADLFTPLILTIFLFVTMINLLGLVPGGATPTSAMTYTAQLAGMVFLVFFIGGILLQKPFLFGFFKNLIPPCPLFLVPLMIVLEVLGLFIKPFALMVRLFANMTAGHCLLLSLGFLTTLSIQGLNNWGYGIPIATTIAIVPIYCLETFVALLQGYIFAYLSAIFIGMYLVPEH